MEKLEYKKEIDSGPKSPRILCIVDNPDWIFYRHVKYLQKYLSDEFSFDIGFRGEKYFEGHYDLIYPLEFNMINSGQIEDKSKYVTGIRSFVSWADWNFTELTEYLNSNFNIVHVVSKQLLEIFSPYLNDVEYVTHGVDTSLFKPIHLSHPIDNTLRLGWAGNQKTYVKGFNQFILPLVEIPGIKLVNVGFSNNNIPLDKMPQFYESIDCYICASSFEGNNNSLLEAAAMEKPIITTPTGTVPEYLSNNDSAIIVERELSKFETAAINLRDDIDLRIKLGSSARASLLRNGWDWKNKAEDYRKLFRRALTNHQPHVKDHSGSKFIDHNHLSQVLDLQVRLLRDLRIGTAIELIEAKEYTESLENDRKELSNLKKTKFFKLYSSLINPFWKDRGLTNKP